MSRQVISREELLDSYARPYRRWLPFALKGYGVHYLTGLTVLAAAIALIGTLADADFADTALSVALLGVAAIVFVSAWALVIGVRVIRERTRQWRADHDDDLARVRERRPHRADEDATVAHLEYAVSVEENGKLVTWEFEPLHAGDEWDEESALITGIPRYEARAVQRVRYDPSDAARERAARRGFVQSSSAPCGRPASGLRRRGSGPRAGRFPAVPVRKSEP